MPLRPPSLRSRRHGAGGEPGQSPWLLTYSDMMTLLLCFFVLLFSFSEIDVQRFRTILAAFQASLGVLDGGRTLIETQPDMQGSAEWELRDVEFYRPELEAQLRAVYSRVRDLVQERGIGATMQVELNERGVTVRFADAVFFDLGKADLKPEALRTLDEVATLLKEVPNHIRIEGHTDNWPIRTERFPSNWELSTARATTVLRYLVEQHGLNPTRVSAAGYGEYRPLMPNDTDENRARNRRVDIVILRLDLGE
ncbi:MAG: hypothetical protein BAA04_05270 [Firmicutes bacterium ZCTH02-B6]|nr:MAG: hypothetical protein BAA04_05270 [Firmicutes bacterium ZCTH02-B6]